MLRHLVTAGDLSGYGLVNAVTHYSHDIEDYDRATDFEAAFVSTQRQQRAHKACRIGKNCDGRRDSIIAEHTAEVIEMQTERLLDLGIDRDYECRHELEHRAGVLVEMNCL